MSRRRAAGSSWRPLLLAATCATVGGVLLGGWLLPQVDRASSEAVASTSPEVRATRPHPRAVGSTVERSATPVRLEIPTIGVTTRLVRLGLMPDRTVEVPGNADLAGWFHRGPAPGRRGSAVILGHVDSLDGPAVFARLQELRPGDDVTIRRDDGSRLRFVVTEAVLYPNADFPAQRVYAARGGRRLNLVTCGGTYDSGRGGYQSNLVVYTHRAPQGLP